jgi:dTDP-D-glucose 4,6-dehydratase
LSLEGGGVAMKSFRYVENLHSAVNLILEMRPQGQIYNCGPDKAISMTNLVREICLVMNKNYEDCIEITEGRMFEDSIYWLNSEKKRQNLDGNKLFLFKRVF